MSIQERCLDSMNLHKVMDSSDWRAFTEEFCSISEDFRDIVGAVAVGSFVHGVVTPDEFYIQRRMGSWGLLMSQLGTQIEEEQNYLIIQILIYGYAQEIISNHL